MWSFIMRFNRLSPRTIFPPAVAWLGILVTLLLFFQQSTLFCGGHESAHSGCDAVTTSVYAKVAGIRLSAIGLVTFSALFVGFLMQLIVPASARANWLLSVVRIVVSFSVVVSVVLISIQAFKIHHFCILCCGSAACFFTLAILLYWPERKPGRTRARSISTSRFLMRVEVAVAVLIPLLSTAGVLVAVLANNKLPHDDSYKAIGQIDGRPITDDDLPMSLRLAIQPVEESTAKARREWLDQYLDEMVVAEEAKRRGTSPKELLAQQTKSVSPPSVADLTAWREDHPDDAAVPEDELITRLNLSKRSAVEDRFIAGLRLSHGATIFVHTRVPPLVHFDLNDAVIDGRADAPAVFVVFSDFECPFCRLLGVNLREVRKQLGDRVAIVFKNLPLEAVHPKAHAFALAAIAAQEQGKFWAFHDALISQEFAADDNTMIEQARHLGLNVPRFVEALHSQRSADRLAADMKEAESLGLQQTPTLFMNGHAVGGLHSVEELIHLLSSSAVQHS